ncbi:carbohydrate porin [Bradyrhizobium manausense]|uniref:carbohydrate porin n=1 Tax=Bradyrhizobium manausense TaxID=989370 RepID=UPI001BA571E1|nr:carbohydrate porin [Bradyrhizobium manausense]MBR0834268.1 carbohydrate porin [Bradyrhizobium manausense]
MQVSAPTSIAAVKDARAADLSKGQQGKPEAAASALDLVERSLCFPARWRQAACAAATAVMFTGSAGAADLVVKAPAAGGSVKSAAYDWSGFYAGMNVGTAWGKSNWKTNGDLGPDSGSLSLANGINIFNEQGSWFNGLQAGYNYQLSNRFLIGAEADVRFSSFPDAMSNLSIGGASNSNNTGMVYSRNIYYSGSVRGRLGYAADNWLFYATGGLAWEVEKSYLWPQGVSNAIASAANVLSSHNEMRLGWAAGAGVETVLSPHWTVRAEYLYSDYGRSSTDFDLTNLGIPGVTQQRVTSSLVEQEIRLGLNYQFGGGGLPVKEAPAPGMESDRFNVHVETTDIWQGYPTFRSPYELPASAGGRSLPGAGQARATTELGLYFGARLWQGSELWIEPEIDQGFGIANTTGLAGYTNAGAFKIGQAEPYARINHFFLRQTIDLGGTSETIAPGLMNFGDKVTSDRLVFTVGKYTAAEIFGRNSYLNPKTDFINWSFLINLPYDFGGDAWTVSMGGAAEWYVGDWAFRAGIFDLSAGPSAGNPLSQLGAVGLDESFKQYNVVGEIERRYTIWDQPGKIKLLGYVDHGKMGSYADALALWNSQGGLNSGTNPDTGLVRKWANKSGVSLNWEQQITNGVGVFAQAGWMNGKYEIFDTSDVDRSLTFGVSIDGDRWSRPGDRIGIAGAVNSISKDYQGYLNAGGFGVLIGDGQLPRPGTENILEAFYRYQINPAAAVTFDYQFIQNPAYNKDRGPVNVFATRLFMAF